MNALLMIVGKFASWQDGEVIKCIMSNQKEQKCVEKWEAAALTHVFLLLFFF